MLCHIVVFLFLRRFKKIVTIKVYHTCSGQNSSKKKNGDTLVMPHGGVPDKNAKDKTARKILEVEQSSSNEEASVQMQILMELKRVSSRLDAVEGQVADVRSSRQQKYLQMKFKQSKLSTSGSGQYSLKHSNNILNSSSVSDSDENGGSFPSLSSAQTQLKSGLRELEASQGESGIDRTAKVKYKRGPSRSYGKA